MFMRFVQLKINTKYLQVLREFYAQIVAPELQQMPGCLFAGIIQGSDQPEEIISLTFWETHEQAEGYTHSDAYQKMIEQIKPMLAESTEWKIQLSDDMQLEYLPVAEEPITKEYTVTAQSTNPHAVPDETPRMYVRIVSVRVQKGMLAEFRNIYGSEIIPTLKKTKGCRFAYLTENIQEEDDAISVTIWDSKEDADNYEKSGVFEDLTEKVKHTFSNLFQWKMALEKDSQGSKISTSADLKVSHYTMVAGRNFGDIQTK